MSTVTDLLHLRFARLLARVRSGFARQAALRAPSGRWVTGSHREPAGALALAPLLAPHRTYRLYLPAGHSEARALPLLVMVHGCRQDAEALAEGTRMNALADREGFMVLYPEQNSIANADRCWNWFDAAVGHGGGEAAIIAGMVRALLASHGVERSRVYVAGLSSGAAMAAILGSCYADLFAACAVHSGMMFQAARSITGARRAIQRGSEFDPLAAGAEAFRLSGHKVDAMPALVIHGSDDSSVSPINAEQVAAQFLHMNRLAQPGVDASSRVQQQPARGASQRSYQVRDHAIGGRTVVRQVIIDGLEHAWSGGDARQPYNDPNGPDASELIWAFFREHRRLPKRAASQDTQRVPAAA